MKTLFADKITEKEVEINNDADNSTENKQSSQNKPRKRKYKK